MHITFLAEDYWREIGLLVKYPLDSLSHAIQQTFELTKVACATSFIERGPRFNISTYCGNGDEVFFSTLYSSKDSQFIDINHFSYRLQNGIWQYHLEYSFDELEITNVHWNPTTMTGMLGDKRESDLLVENIPVRDLKCVIDFELPED